jgi:D-alanyl-D-alanine carboxypeptidase/D-alanyl-D-alanine-endopeptidase (penicillin-binding protein 4)
MPEIIARRTLTVLRPALVGLAAVCLALAAVRGAAAQRPASGGDGAHHGYLAARMAGDGRLEVIDERDAGRFFVPASVLKVVTVAAAIEHLGIGYRWRTRLTSTGAVAGAVLDGDLVIEPGGDPTWGRDRFPGGAAEPLAALAGQVRAHGITRIRGDLVVDASRFPGRPHPLDRTFGDLPYRHGTPSSPLAVDEATITVRVAPGPSIGAPARVQAPDGVTVINLTTTAGRDRHGAGTLDFLPVWGTDTLLLRGEYPLSEPPFVVPVSDPAPALRAARRLRAALDEAGVAVDGGVRVQRAGAAAGDQATLLAELRSPPLDDLLDAILTDSHNWYADTLALTLGLEVAGSGRFDDGVEVIADFAADLPDDGALAPGDLSIRDGSGLSTANLVTPATVVRVLAHAAGRPWGGRLLDALARPGEGTLAAWPRLPRIAAKTGTLRHTVALAGILDPDSETPVFFCYFVNHHRRPAAARREIAAALRSWRAGERAGDP